MSDFYRDELKRTHEWTRRAYRLIGSIQAHVEMAQKRSPHGLAETPKQAIDAIANLLAEFDAKRGESGE